MMQYIPQQRMESMITGAQYTCVKTNLLSDTRVYRIDILKQNIVYFINGYKKILKIMIV